MTWYASTHGYWVNYKPNQDNAMVDAWSCKMKYWREMSCGTTQILYAIYSREGSLEYKIKEGCMKYHLAKHSLYIMQCIGKIKGM